MPSPFPSGSYSAAGKLVEDPERGGMNFVPDPGSWADPEPMDTEAFTEVPEPEELAEPNPELKEGTEMAHHVHELTDGVTEDLDGSKELHEALEQSSTEAHGPGTANHHQELHSAGAHMGETRMADNMGVDAWHPTADTTGVLYAAVAAAAAANALHGIFKKEGPEETPREPAPEAQAQPDHSGGTAEVPPPADPAIQAPVAEESAAPQIPDQEQPAPPSFEAEPAEEQTALEAQADMEVEQISGAEEPAPQQVEAAARKEVEAETSTSRDSSPSKEAEKSAETAATAPSMSPSFGSF